MSKQRYLDTKFWDDNYIITKDPTEKLLFIYLLTNPLTNILGIYEISPKRIAFDTGIEEDMISKILQRFEEDNKVKYFKGFIAIKNFTKHQKENEKISRGMELLLEGIPKGLKKLIDWVSIDYDRLSIGYPYPLNYININTNSNSNSNSNNNSSDSTEKPKKTFDKKPIDIDKKKKNKEIIKETILYLNKKTGKNFRSDSKIAVTNLTARINEKHTIGDFKKVVDIKVSHWLETIDGKLVGVIIIDEKGREQDMSIYLSPDTLFGNKFEKYLNQNASKEQKGGNNIGKPKKFANERDYTPEEWRDIESRFAKK